MKQLTAPDKTGELLRAGQLLTVTGSALVEWITTGGVKNGPVKVSSDRVFGPFDTDIQLIISALDGVINYEMKVYAESREVWPATSYVEKLGTLPTFIDITDAVADYAAVVTNNSLVAESTDFHKSSAKTIHLNTVVNNPAGSAYIQADNKSIAMSNDLANVPSLFVFYAPLQWDAASSGLELWLSNGAGLSGTNRSRADLSYKVHPGWNVIAIDKRTASIDPFTASWVANGTAGIDFAQPIVSYRVKLFGDTARYSHLYVDSFLEGYQERPKCCFTMDDNRDTGYSIGYIQARRRNIKTSMFNIFDRVGSANYATLAQMQQMASDPLCYMGLHGAARFDGQGSGAGTDPRTEMLRNINGLKTLGLSDCKYMAWPEGAMAGNVPSISLDVAASLGIEGARSTQKNYQWFYKGAYNPLAINSIALNNSTTLAQAKTAIDTAIAWGCSVVFYSHKFGAAADSETWVTQDYLDLLDYFQTKKNAGLIDDMRFDEFMEYGKSAI
jgi:hypothetical protein